MFGDLDWPLNASRGLSAIAEFLVELCGRHWMIRQHRVTLPVAVRQWLYLYSLHTVLWTLSTGVRCYHSRAPVQAHSPIWRVESSIALRARVRACWRSVHGPRVRIPRALFSQRNVDHLPVVSISIISAAHSWRLSRAWLSQTKIPRKAPTSHSYELRPLHCRCDPPVGLFVC